MKKFNNQRICVLVDAENLEITTRKLFHANIDYKELFAQFNEREVVRALYYNKKENLFVEGKDGENKAEGFLHFLETVLGFEIKTPPKDADTYLCIDAVSLAAKTDVAIIVAGDKDYIPLIHYLQAQGVRCEIWSWPERTSEQLKAAADFFVALSAKFLRT